MSNVNIPLLRKIVEWVEEQETLTENREWYQGWWISGAYELSDDQTVMADHFCDTAFCVAGKVVKDAGWHPLLGGHDVQLDDVVRPVRDVAMDLLDIGEGAAIRLFDGDNCAADIRRIAEDLAGERL